MKITVNRKFLRPNYTVGVMSINGVRFCDTLEDTVRDVNKNGVFDGNEKKIYGETAIPYGTYNAKIGYSPKFKRSMIRIQDVPHFDGILIHAGNTAKDSSGCILVGENKVVGGLINSRITIDRLYKIVEDAERKGESIIITIE